MSEYEFGASIAGEKEDELTYHAVTNQRYMLSETESRAREEEIDLTTLRECKINIKLSETESCNLSMLHV